jgi:hypothetical protein
MADRPPALFQRIRAASVEMIAHSVKKFGVSHLPAIRSFDLVRSRKTMIDLLRQVLAAAIVFFYSKNVLVRAVISF